VFFHMKVVLEAKLDVFDYRHFDSISAYRNRLGFLKSKLSNEKIRMSVLQYNFFGSEAPAYLRNQATGP
jgi:hypothetical protein